MKKQAREEAKRFKKYIKNVKRKSEASAVIELMNDPALLKSSLDFAKTMIEYTRDNMKHDKELKALYISVLKSAWDVLKKMAEKPNLSPDDYKFIYQQHLVLAKNLEERSKIVQTIIFILFGALVVTGIVWLALKWCASFQGNNADIDVIDPAIVELLDEDDSERDDEQNNK